MYKSIWEEVQIEARPQLNENKKTEVVVVGAGLTGLLVAYYLQKSGKKVIVLEANRIGSGATCNTTAKITSQHNLIYKELIDYFGQEKAKEYADYNECAIAEYARLVEELKIDCDFETKDSYVYSTFGTQALEEEVTAAKSLGIDASLTTKTALPFPVFGAVKFPNQAQFHPLKFLKAIAEELEIYEQSKVIKRKGEHVLQVVVSNNRNVEKIAVQDSISIDHVSRSHGDVTIYEVEADTIILANHYPIERLKGLYAVRMYQQRENVLVLDAPDALPYGMYVAARNTGYSFRKYGDYLIIAGMKHRPGLQLEENSIEDMEEEIKQYYKDANVCYRMVNQDCITLDKVPYIGHFTKGSKNVYIATGFNKWGMSHAMVSALFLRDMICNGDEKENSIYCPSRFRLKASKVELKQHISTTTKQIILRRFSIPKEMIADIKPGEGCIRKKGGRALAIYRAEDGTVHSFLARCPHLGCILEWNQAEQSWDCPCHGSRFTKEGQLISGPAKVDMKAK